MSIAPLTELAVFLTDVSALKATTIFGGTSIRCPFDGLTTIRSIRFFISKIPKLAIEIPTPSSNFCDI
uniref:hypothetical protein n=1 Tax=Prevotella sp. TaxID=59823 RepID=UPI00307B4E3B